MENKKISINWAMIGRDVKRHWPIWAVTMVVYLFAVTGVFSLFTYLNSDQVQVTKDLIKLLMNISIFISFVSGFIISMAGFGYLGKKQKHYLYEALPMNRASLFVTRFIFEFIVIQIPCIFIFIVELIQAMAVSGYFMIGELAAWLLIIAILNLFWLSFGMLFTVICGRRLMVCICYAAFSFIGFVLEYTVAAFDTFMFIGYGTGFSGYEVFRLGILSPIEYIFSSGSQVYEDYIGINGYFGAGRLMAVLASAIVLFAVSYILYKKRKAERTGDNIVFPIVKTVCSCVFTLIFAVELTFLCLSMFVYQSEGVAHNAGVRLAVVIMIIVFGIAGYMLSCMIIEKKFRVFKKNILKASIFTGILALFLILYMHDIFGIEKKVPDIEDVSAVMINGSQINTKSIYRNVEKEKMSADEIEKIVEVHKIIAGHMDEMAEAYKEIDERYFYTDYTANLYDYPEEMYETYMNDVVPINRYKIYITYQLKNGETIYKDYYVKPEGEPFEEIKAYVNKFPDIFYSGGAEKQFYFN